MAGLPSVMQAKKAQMQVDLPPINEIPKPVAKKPIPVSLVTKKEEPKKEDEKELDISEFIVADGEKKEKKEDGEVTEVTVEGEQKPPVQVEKKDDEQNDWKWKFESLKGNHEIIVGENRQLRDRLVVLESKFDELNKKPVQPVKEEPSLELSKEEVDEYGPALPVLTKLLTKQRREIEDSVVKPLQNEIESLKRTSVDSTKKFEDAEGANFLQQVKLQVKDFDTMVQSQKWKDFAAKPLSDYTDETIGVALMNAHQKRDLGKIVRIFNDFGKSQTNNMSDAFRAPSVSSASGELPVNGKKPMLKWSERKKASLKMQKRQISPEDFTKIAELYRQADAEGRVDYDK